MPSPLGFTMEDSEPAFRNAETLDELLDNLGAPSDDRDAREMSFARASAVEIEPQYVKYLVGGPEESGDEVDGNDER